MTPLGVAEDVDRGEVFPRDLAVSAHAGSAETNAPMHLRIGQDLIEGEGWHAEEVWWGRILFEI